MDSKFVLCSKCGTRNFSDDKKCGICNAKLPLIEQKKDDSIYSTTSKQNWSRYLIIGVIVLIVIYFYFPTNIEKTSESRNLYSNSDKSISKTYDLSATSISYSYTIKKVSVNNKRHFNVDVTISNKVSNSQLIEAAYKIKKEINATANIGIVGFFLPGMKIGNGAWATVTFDPEPIVSTFGLSVEVENRIRANLPKDCDCIGMWLDNTKSDEVAIRIRDDEVLGFVIEFVSPTKPERSNLATPVTKTKLNGKTIYRDTNHTEQYYIINSDGDLMVYDNFGYFDTFQKLM